ncbi:MAG TPA: hypothetical protein VJ773_08665, partial [Gemmatimonadales bacterium]|nr:hypothetical protein [Gemmatimonadales bacterium]
SLALALGEAADTPADWPGLGRRDPGPLRLLVAGNRAEFERFSRGRLPGWGAGVALPGARIIVVRVDAGAPFRILRHELAHLALHEAVRVRVPRWFDEGWATWSAGEWDRLDALGLHWRVARGNLPSLREVDAALQGATSDADAAYAFAVTAVTELARRNPTGGLEPLFGRLEAGLPFDSAVTLTTGLPPDRFEVAWQRDLRRRYGLLTWLMAGGLWVLLATLPFLLLVRRRRRDRRRRAALDVGWDVPGEDTLSPPWEDGDATGEDWKGESR